MEGFIIKMITKNKETIEKLQEGCFSEFSYDSYDSYDICQKGGLCPRCEGKIEATIKTSIEWCEDEIDFLNLKKIQIVGKTKDIEFEIRKRLQQLTFHLKWLKQQE